jgi:DNA repair exonuclease SbcCD ATPase subunit
MALQKVPDSADTNSGESRPLDFNGGSYFPILTSIIRVDRVVPFSCFILLRANQRVVRLVAADHPFEQAILDKLSKFKIDQIYVQASEQLLYEKYLRDYLQTDEGKTVLQDIQEKGAQGIAVEGIPETIAQELKVPVPESSKATSGAEPPAAEPPAPDPGEVKVETAPVAPEAPVQGASDSSDEFAEVIKLLRDQAEELDEEIKSEDVEAEDNNLVKGVTARLQDALVKVQSKALTGTDGSSVIQDVVEKFREEMQRVKGFAEKPGRPYRLINHQMEDIAKKVAEIAQVGAKGKTLSQGDRILVRDRAREIETDLLRVRHLVNHEKKELVGDTVNSIITGLESLIGAKIEIRKPSETAGEGLALKLKKLALEAKAGPQEFEKLKDQAKEIYSEHAAKTLGEDPNDIDKLTPEQAAAVAAATQKAIEAVKAAKPGVDPVATAIDTAQASIAQSTSINAQAEGLAKLTGSETPEELKQKILAQNQAIVALNERLKQSQDSCRELQRSWQELQGKTFKKMTEQERLSAKDFSAQVNSLSNLQEDATKQGEKVERDSEALCQTVGVTKETFANAKRPEGLQLPGENGTLSAADQQKQVEAMKRAAEALEVPPESPADADAETLRTENQVLRAQLADAKSLMIKTNEKVIELQGFVDRSSTYIQDLEKEHSDLMKEIEKNRSQIADLEKNNQGLSDVADTAQKIANRAKSVIQGNEQTIERMKERIETLEKELGLFKQKFPDSNKDTNLTQEELDRIPPDVLSVLRQKDREISKLTVDIDAIDKSYKASEKNVTLLKSRIEESALLKKRMAARFERLDAEKEDWRRKHDQLDRRLIALNNVLDKERHTISRLSTIAEDLKKDRVEFMNKTNSAMKAHKDAISKTNSLNNAVQKEMERNRKLQDQIAHYKEKIQEMAGMMSKAQATIKTLETELRKFKKAA